MGHSRNSWSSKVNSPVQSICSDFVDTILCNDILPIVLVSPWSSLGDINPSTYGGNCILDSKSSNIHNLLRTHGRSTRPLYSTANYCI